ncbi:MAG: ankyrin repeat domain-containing protein [Limisphaerales bacterium]
MTQPDALKSAEPLVWLPGRGMDVWAMFQACIAGDVAAVRSLLDGDPSLVRCQYAYRTPLYFAVRENRPDIVALLFERGADPLGLAVDDSLVEIASDRGHRELEAYLRAALVARFSAGDAGEPVAAAIRERNAGRVRELLDADPDRIHAGDGRSNQPIHWAVMTRQLDMIDLLLERGASIDARRSDGARPIHLTNGDDHFRGWRDVPPTVTTTPDEVYRHLVDRGAEVDLGMAAAKGDFELLFRHGMDPNGRDWLGVSPLHGFARKGDVENAVLFLEHGADLDARDGVLLSTPLGYAAKFGRIRMVEFLLRRGARIRLPDDPPWATPLAWAARRGHVRIADLLRFHTQWGVLPRGLSLDQHESLAADWIQACDPGDSGDPEAARRLADHFQIERVPTPSELREELRRRFPGLGDSGPRTLEDGRMVVAGMHGFGDWRELERHVAECDRELQKVAVWEAVDRALVAGDADALEGLLSEGMERLPKRPKGAYPGCAPVLDPGMGAKGLILREHHFAQWEEFLAFRTDRNRPSTEVADFEDAVDAVVSGDVAALRRLLDGRPELARARSRRLHRATLLHYVGANGVEGFRQRTPANAVEIAELLIGAGSEVEAVAGMYGGSTTLGLVATSIHPWIAGVQLDLIRTLLDHGAVIDRPQGDGRGSSIVLGCLANGRREASEFLASRGAVLDFESAAGLGYLDKVRDAFDAEGRLHAGVSDDQLQSGFQWACEYGRTDVVDFLLTRGAGVGRVHRGRTGLHWAAYGGHPDIVRRLLDRGAPVDIGDGTWGTTPLGWAMYGWFQPPGGAILERYPEVVSELVRRGGQVQPEWVADPRVRSNRAMAVALSKERSA